MLLVKNVTRRALVDLTLLSGRINHDCILYAALLSVQRALKSPRVLGGTQVALAKDSYECERRLEIRYHLPAQVTGHFVRAGDLIGNERDFFSFLFAIITIAETVKTQIHVTTQKACVRLLW